MTAEYPPRRGVKPLANAAGLLAVVALLAGCDRPQITAYRVAKDKPAREAPSFNWKVPEGWQALAVGQMQAAKFAVPSQGAAKAEVSVSIFPVATGNTLMNVNRWRGQIGLESVGDADLAKLVTPLDPKNPEAILVDMTNNTKRIVGAIVPRGGQWFFYKLLGDAGAVAPQKDAFVQFVQSQP